MKEENGAMLEHELLTETGILIVRPKGPLAASDFAALSVDADAYIEAHRALNGLMICAEEFPTVQSRISNSFATITARFRRWPS